MIDRRNEWKHGNKITILCFSKNNRCIIIPASRQKMKTLQIQIESARAIPGSAKVRNVSSACGSVITYESVTVVRQESSPGWFTGYYLVWPSPQLRFEVKSRVFQPSMSFRLQRNLIVNGSSDCNQNHLILSHCTFYPSTVSLCVNKPLVVFL